ncbi:MAG: hypothetical protein KTR32_41185 [Granulosicoccus sp.]|nr:hypothetical protein [Granulosicoccus sp.]
MIKLAAECTRSRNMLLRGSLSGTGIMHRMQSDSHPRHTSPFLTSFKGTIAIVTAIDAVASQIKA